MTWKCHGDNWKGFLQIHDILYETDYSEKRKCSQNPYNENDSTELKMDVSADTSSVQVKPPVKKNTGQLTFTHAASKSTTQYRFARLRMGLALAFSDALALFVSCASALFIWSFVREDLSLSFYINLIPLIPVFLTTYFITGLYTSVGMNPVEELRQQTIVTTVAFLGLGALSFWLRNAESYSRASLLLGCGFSLILLPFCREMLRSVLARHACWGEPVALIGYGGQGAKIFDFLIKNPQLGYNPVVVINGFHNNAGDRKPDANHCMDVPIIAAQGLTTEQNTKILKHIRTAILIEADVPDDFFQAVVEEHGFRFSNLIWVSDSKRFGSLWVTPVDIGGVLGLRVSQNLVSRWQKTLKRILDLSLVILASPLVLFVTLILAILIGLDSKGYIFYGHERIGQNGKRIKVWKFRTMVSNADEILEACFEQNPELKKEWETSQKMRFDPRVTRVGKFLRKTSLDELPQVWNVIKGEMSLVGPRPIIDEEVKHYANHFKIYLQVKPGITGLWQISGRNNLDYPIRVQLDEYYVRNWSVWFDIYILTHTLGSVINGKGAY